MKKLKFFTAVLICINELTQTNKPFSAHDVTKKIREKVNNGEVQFSDRDQEYIDDVLTQKVNHLEIREIVRELYENYFVFDWDIQRGAGFILYAPKNSTAIPVNQPVQVIDWPSDKTTDDIKKLFSQPIGGLSNRSPVTLAHMAKVKTYLAKKKALGQSATLKDVTRALGVKGVYAEHIWPFVVKDPTFSYVMNSKGGLSFTLVGLK